ncbi:SDR family NAD(P)-dependent oxidoreductase [Paracidobacterium acidisoli]|uniref:SDR family oxidoreductase n=1 Tax=Paracidobacterium acidisoli TaxID=2303751 RepID=A0A372ILU3_9BACT|nr:SDR family oxidoreductase [Paracidobacterium acidisoli]MBT9332322.1 SDR family oxidoreductase [Paracidobacterium acidisoli]
MDTQIKGKTACVTAGAHGIGEAIADLLTEEGAHVFVADLDGAALRETASRRAGVIEADLATAEGVNDLVSEVRKTFGGPPDILVNNLGVGDAASFEEISDERWADSLAVNLMGTIRICRALLPEMAKRGSGSVVNIGSDLAKQPEPTMMDYGVCKAGLLYLTKALARQYISQVRVNVVLPGPIWSRMWTRPGGIVDQLVAQYNVDREEALERFLKERYMPMGIGQPQDVAQAVVFLASPLAKFITGASLDIGGTLRSLI